ncbi:PAS domain S-box protein [Bacillus sp. B15-48]|uniref:PAS domain S-box protein n=1 Tax=Bacillus sp. B15-48 TaxID=1548601 RepID=UPI00193F335A|nr:PAS domain S-box protein [Bacillus sp. B15-48]MBM4761401.1 PAS domain S-box protein [Bacillus sp. B15-48]
MKRLLDTIEDNVFVFSSMFDSIKDLVVLMEVDDGSLRYTYMNRSALQIHNMSESVFGKKIEEVLPEEQSRLLLEKYKLIQSTQKPVEFTEEITTETSVFIGEISLNPIEIEDGERKFVVAIVRDITDRKQKELELNINQKRYQSLFEHNGDAAFEFDLQGNIVHINERASEISGYDKIEVLGKSFMPFIAEEDLEHTFWRFNEALNGSNEEYETSIYHKNGQRIPLHVKSIPIIIDGILTGVYGIGEDITLEKQAKEEIRRKTKELEETERELRKSREKYRLITENAFDVIELLDPSGLVEYVSPSNEKLIGYSAAEYIGQSFLSYIHPDEVSLLKEKFNDMIEGHNPSTSEIRARHKDGHYIWIESNTAPVVENGEVRQLVTISRDTTEKKRLQEELEKAAFYDYLSGLPNRQLFHDRLQIAIQQADRSEKKVAVMMLDGNKFKQINDTYGHDAGDAVIVEMAKRLKACVRDNDTVARMGGDEMAIILPEIDSVKVAEQIAERIVQSFQQPFHFQDKEIQMGAGIGVALYPDQTSDYKLLVKYADIALYEAKDANKSEFKFYRRGESQ